jgi:hypothetical protein
MVFHSGQSKSESVHLSNICRIVLYAGKDKHSSSFRRTYPSISIICPFASKPLLIGIPCLVIEIIDQGILS